MTSFSRQKLQVVAIALQVLFLTACGGSGGSGGPAGSNATNLTPPSLGNTTVSAQHLYVPLYNSQNGNQTIAWYPLTATGTDPKPAGEIDTGLQYIDFFRALAFDPSGYLYVLVPNSTSNDDLIAVYAPGASGNARPVRTIPKPLRNGVPMEIHAIAADQGGNLYVAGLFFDPQAESAIAVYPPQTTTPDHYIIGPQTGLAIPQGITFERDGRIVVANIGSGICGPGGSVTVYAPGASGDAIPVAFYNSPELSGPLSVAVDNQRNIYALNSNNVASKVRVVVYADNGRNKPIAILTGNSSTGEGNWAMALDADGNVYISTSQTIGAWPPLSAWRVDGTTPETRQVRLTDYSNMATFTIH